MTTERGITRKLLNDESKLSSGELLSNIHFKGLWTLTQIFGKIPEVGERYGKIINNHSGTEKGWLEPKKTLLASFAALETFSDLKMEDLHRQKLVIPVVFFYQALACKWDDCIDGRKGNPEDAWKKRDENGLNAEELWTRGIHLISSNININDQNKKNLVRDLDEAKANYINYESMLKDPDVFKGLSPFETYVLALQIRKKSFGNMAEVLTRVFNKGVKDEKLEKRMSNATLAFGMMDGMDDLKEDEICGTMTEARGLVSLSRSNRTPAKINEIKFVSTLLR